MEKANKKETTDKEFTKEIKITKTVHPGGRVEYTLNSNVEPDELMGIMTRITHSLQNQEPTAQSPDQQGRKSSTTYIG